MTETIEYEQFEQSGNGSAPALASASDVDLSRLSDIPMELSVEIGRTHMTVGETLDLRVGSVVTLERLAGETADLLVNGSAIARGEVVVIDEQYGLRITEILDGQSEPASSPEGELAQPVAGAAGSGHSDARQDAAPASVAAAPEPAGELAAAAEPEPAAEPADGSPADEG